MSRAFTIRLTAFIFLTALGLAAWRLGLDYLRSPHSEIVDFKLNPVPDQPNREAI